MSIRAWLRIALAVWLSSLASIGAAQLQYGGAAPLPSCRIHAWPQCHAEQYVAGIQAALPGHCAQYAASHSSRGGAPWCGLQMSTITQCRVDEPVVPTGYAGGNWAVTSIVMGGVDTEPFNYGQGPVYGTWGGSYAGPACFCPGNALIKPDATCACPVGMNWNAQEGRCAPKPPDPVVISLTGDTDTRALPVGPILHFTASVERGGLPVDGNEVSIWVGDGRISGLTDAGGNFRFSYVPPVQQALSFGMSATCIGCSNSIDKTVTVSHCETCEAGFGNPIQPATGEKQQTEVDWADSGAHALDWVREYRSQGTSQAGLGANWSHNYAVTNFEDKEIRTITFGGGYYARFHRLGDRWVPNRLNPNDRLTEVGAELIYTRSGEDVQYRFALEGLNPLIAITQRNGWTKTLAYDAELRLASVTNHFGRTLRFVYTAGQLTSVVTPDGQTIQYNYDAQRRLSTVTQADGSARQYHYEDARFASALTGVTDESGQRYSTFTYDPFGRVSSTELAGGVGRYSVTLRGEPPLANRVLRDHVGDDAYLSLNADVRDPLGNTRNYSWLGRLGQARRVAASGPFDGEATAARNLGTGHLPGSETDFLGTVTQHTWNERRDLKLSSTFAAGQPQEKTVQTEWHPAFRLPVLLTEPGKTTAFTYDNAGNKLTETVTDTATGQTRRWAWTYTAGGLAETMTEPGGSLWRNTYDAAGNRVSQRDPLARETRWTHDAAGRILSQADPGGLTTSFTYDARGRLTAIQRADETSSYSYTATGQLASASLPNGTQVRYAYDAAQRLIGAQDNQGNTISYTLDAAGNRIREEVKDAAGAIAWATTRTVNALNRLEAVQTASGRSTFGYDANGELVRQTDPLNQSTRQTLDPLRRPSATTFPDNSTASQAWNQLDQLTRVTDPKGVATTYTTNAFGEVMSETSPDIGTIRYERDANGEVTRSEDAKGQIAQIERDALGRATRIAYASDHQVFTSYDAAGEVSRLEDPSGSTTYERDALGRITAKTQDVNDVAGTPSRFRLQYSYAQASLAGLTYPSGLKVSYQRSNGRITGIEVQEPSANANRPKPVTAFLSNLTHTALGQPKAWSWFNGDSAQRTFDADGRMTANEFASYSFDAASRITGITQSLHAQGTGTVTAYVTPLHWQAGYDSRNRLVSFVRNGAETRYSYDANSNRLTALDKTTSDTDLDGEFDETDFGKNTSQSLNIEASSNRLLGFTQTTTTTNKGKTKSVVVSPVTYRLDANGALTSDGLRDFDYDASNRLAKVRIVKDGEAASIRYLTNALGQRVFKGEPEAEQTLPSEETLGVDFITWLKKQFGWMFVKAAANTSIGTGFLYADDNGIPSWAILGEYDNGSAKGKGRTEYIWLPTEDGQAIPVGIYRNGKFYAIHSDHLGTPRLMTDEAKAVVWQWPYSAFGNNKPTGILKETAKPRQGLTNEPALLKATHPVELNLRFPGQVADEETGSFYNYFRNYQPGHGRYTQSDPIGLAGGLNPYLYVDADPVLNADPLGLVRKTSDPIGMMPLEGGGGGMPGAGPWRNPSSQSSTQPVTNSGQSFPGRSGPKATQQTHDVYLGYSNGRPVYVGISSRLGVRTCEHSRFDAFEKITSTRLTKDQARAIEQLYINEYPLFWNEINSIAPTRAWYPEAMRWAEKWKRSMGK